VFQAHAGLPGTSTLSLLIAVTREPRLVRLDEVDRLLSARSSG
jgi:hypothetical protein